MGSERVVPCALLPRWDLIASSHQPFTMIAFSLHLHQHLSSLVILVIIFERVGDKKVFILVLI